jgi:sulfite reductase (NADPH) flavoprotein alpha-component
VHLVRVSVNRRLTPAAYDRNVFHLELDTSGTGLRYEIGSALAVHGRNGAAEVAALLAALGLPPRGVVSIEADADEAAKDKDKAATANAGAAGVTAPPARSLWTLQRLFEQRLDAFGRPGKDFYEALAPHARDARERAQLELLSGDAGADALEARARWACTFADALVEFGSARPPLAALIAMIPPIKPRHYSIASSMRAHPHSVHLLVVEVEWAEAPGRPGAALGAPPRRRFGQCSHYLANLAVGDEVAVSVTGSEMHLPVRAGAVTAAAAAAAAMY